VSETVDALYALLFVAESPSTARELAAALQIPEGVVEQGLEILDQKLESDGPIQLVKLAGGYQLSTKPRFAELLSAFLHPQKQRLSRSLLEVLAIIAYRQPITMAEMDSTRGVQSDYSVKALMERGLVREVGRKQTPGRPVLYGTSESFLHQFNLNDLSDLPPLDASSLDSPLLATL
jgi:segregation and condensation protein B